MRRLLYFAGIALSAIVIGATSCGNSEGDARGKSARELYEKTIRLNARYTDSLRVAKDSATVERLSKSYEEALTRLNFEYPADTDLEMSEGENDTLVNINLRYVSLRDSLLYRFAHPIVLVQDSTENQENPAKNPYI